MMVQRKKLNLAAIGTAPVGNRFFAALLCCCFAAAVLTGCGGNNDSDVTESETTSSVTETSDEQSTDTSAELSDEEDDEETISVYTGRAVENEEDLAIFKISITPPDGYEVRVDNSEGKMYSDGTGNSVIIKAQNFKEEFQELEVFADSGCASIKINNMLYQCDTDFSEPIKTTVAGFDAIRYDYHITSYIFDYELDEDGNPLVDENDQKIVKDKRVNAEYDDRVYYFYSDEDVFYIILESPSENAEASAADFDSIIESVVIS